MVQLFESTVYSSVHAITTHFQKKLATVGDEVGRHKEEVAIDSDKEHIGDGVCGARKEAMRFFARLGCSLRDVKDKLGCLCKIM